jgi:succinoglycan biosynthesis transport protein ExoP
MDSVDKTSHGNPLSKYLRSILRHRFLIVIPLVLVFFGATIVGSSLPKVYKATALFRDIDPDVGERGARRSSVEGLEVMRAIILSRSNLVDVIKAVGLDAPYRDLSEDQKSANEDRLVKKLKKNLQIEEKATRVYAVSYKDEDPDLVHRVANEVVQEYIDGVIQKETKDLNDNVSFLKDEVNRWREKVKESSEALNKFKVDHALNLPDTPLSDIDVLVKIMEDLQTAEQALSDAETAKKEIEKQIAEFDQEELVETVVKESPLVSDYRGQLIVLEQKLAKWKAAGLTEAHPAVIELKKEMETVESLMKEAANKTTTEQKRQTNPVFLSLQQELKKAEVDIVKAQKNRERFIERKKTFEERVKLSPVVQGELTKLMDEDRQLQETLDDYNKQLITRTIELAKQNSRKEARFPIQDYARRPSSPEGSTRLKVAFLGLIFGGGLGLGLSILKDQMDSSFKNVEDAASCLDIPIVGTIPSITTAAEKTRERKRQTWGWMVVGALVIVLGAALAVITLTSL